MSNIDNQITDELYRYILKKKSIINHSDDRRVVSKNLIHNKKYIHISINNIINDKFCRLIKETHGRHGAYIIKEKGICNILVYYIYEVNIDIHIIYRKNLLCPY